MIQRFKLVVDGSIFLLLSQLVLDGYVVLLDSELSCEQGFKLVHEVSLHHDFFSCVFAWQVLDGCAAGKFDLKLMCETVDLLDQLLGLDIGRGKGLNSNDLGHVFVDNLISNQLDSFEDAFSK